MSQQFSEFEELEENCTISDTVTADGIPGAVITSLVTGYGGRSIFIPLSGRYSGDEPIGVGEEFQLWGSSANIHNFSDDVTNCHECFPSGMMQ